jgi:hypothetical protein
MSMTAIITTGIALLAVTILAAIIIRHLPPSLSNRRESERTGQ